jgi:hypothetical protein
MSGGARGYSLLLKMSPGSEDKAFAKRSGVNSPTSVGSSLLYIVPSRRISPSIISGWRAKHSLMGMAPSGVSMGARSSQVSADAGAPGGRFCRTGIGRDFASGVGLERRDGEPDGANKVGAVGEIAPDGRICLFIV